MDTMFKLRWAGAETGPYTKEQIDDQLGSRKIGLACEVNYKGKWILLETFNAALEKDAQDLRDQEKKRILQKEKDAADAAAAKLKEEEKEQAAIDHVRKMELLDAEKPSPPETVPLETTDDPTPPPPPWDNSPAGAKSGGKGFVIFIVIVLGILWYQGYLDPADIPALWGDSKYIDVVRNAKDEGADKTIGQIASLFLTSVTWESSRGDNRKEIRVILSGKVDESLRQMIWIVNKRDRTYVEEE